MPAMMKCSSVGVPWLTTISSPTLKPAALTTVRVVEPAVIGAAMVVRPGMAMVTVTLLTAMPLYWASLDATPNEIVAVRVPWAGVTVTVWGVWAVASGRNVRTVGETPTWAALNVKVTVTVLDG